MSLFYGKRGHYLQREGLPLIHSFPYFPVKIRDINRLLIDILHRTLSNKKKIIFNEIGIQLHTQNYHLKKKHC